jgi:NRAMP (natural resistance-associated macrophage protein)-like metal ion transporter
MAKKLMERIAEAPAVALEDAIEAAGRAERAIISKAPFRKAEEYWNTLGPGLTTGAADDDPSGIATYSQTGAQFGYKFLWLAPFSFPLMAIIQEMCARIGLVTGQGLAANIRRHFPKGALYACAGLLLIANSFNIGADLGAMAESTRLIAPQIPSWVLLIAFAAASLLLQIFTTYARYAKFMKYLALVLLAYVVSAFMASIDWGAALRATFIPALASTKEEIILVCGIFGTTISPYLFFWQTSQEVEERILRGLRTLRLRHFKAEAADIKKMRIDVWTGMFFSNIAMFFIIVTCAGVLFQHGVTNIGTAAEAALALKPFAGPYASLLFTIGVLGVGFLAIPVLAGSASYAISESLGWKFGLYRKLKEARAFYGIITISMLIGFALNFVGLDPIKALLYAAVLNGIVAPIILFFIVKLSSDRHVMGHWANGKILTGLGWIVVAVMGLVGIATIASIAFA